MKGIIMRRKDKIISDRKDILDILTSNTICRLGLCLDNQPYVLPLSYGFSDNNLYIHCAQEGKKLDIIRQNPVVSFEISDSLALVEGKGACDYTLAYRCCLGSGIARELERSADKKRALNVIMEQHTTKSDWDYPETMLERTCIIEIEIRSLSAKRNR